MSEMAMLRQWVANSFILTPSPGQCEILVALGLKVRRVFHKEEDMPLPVRFLIAAVALCTSSAAAVWAQSYTFTNITVSGSTDIYAYKINNAGQVAGFYLGTTASEGFLYSGGMMRNIVFPGAGSTAAMGINNPGQIAGYYNGGNCKNADAVCGFIKTSGGFRQV